MTESTPGRARRVLFALCTPVVLLAMPSCTAAHDATHPAGAGQQQQQTADPATVAPGTLLASSPFPTVDVRVSRGGASATRITYRSTSGIDESPTAVTGVVFIPRDAPPPGGWPVVSYGHPGAGILEKCAPSQDANLLGNGAAVEPLLRQGYLVVMPDYQGIGSKGPHPFLEPKTLGYNMIDAVRAARQLEPRAGSRWAAYGTSEGGEAAWAAAELAPSYGQGLDMVAAVALNPTANMSAMPQVALDGKLDVDQLPMMLYIANTVAALYPDVPRDDYVHGYTRDNNEALMACNGEDLVTRGRLQFGMSAEDLVPVSREAADRLSAILQGWSLPGSWGPAQVPVLVAVGAADAVVPPDWTRAAVRATCLSGEQVTWLSRPAEGHDDLNAQQALTWLANRFKGIAGDSFAGPSVEAVCGS